MVCEVFGSWDPAALPILKATADQFATHQGLNPALALQFLATRLSVALMRQNVRMLLARAPCVDIEEEKMTGGGDCGSDDDDDALAESIFYDKSEAADFATPEGSDSDADDVTNDGADGRAVTPTA